MLASPTSSARCVHAVAVGQRKNKHRSIKLNEHRWCASGLDRLQPRPESSCRLTRTRGRTHAVKVASAASSVSAGQGSKSAKKREVLVTADGMSKSHDGMRNLFEKLSLTVGMGDRVAIIGPNGSGKSSLLKIIAGKDDPTDGTVSRRKMLKVGMLEQEPEIPEHLGALEAVLNMDTPVSRAVAEYEAAVAAMERGDPGASEQLNKCTVAMDTEGAWELAARAKTALETLGMTNPALKIADMSGGQRRRVALASAMLAEPDLMLLDEPTNHMDTDVIRWMMDWLERTQQQMAVVLVTHDRHFMESVCTGVLELDYDGSSHLHKFGGKGSYERFHAARDARRNAQAAVAANAKNTLRKETEWMRRQPKARSTKSKARIEAFYDLTKTAKSGPSDDLKVDFDQGSGMQRQGKRVMELKDAGYSWGDKLIFQDLTYTFQKGDKIGIVGRNGSGKSTFLDVITGRCSLTEGSMEVGEKTQIGYFTQHPPTVPDDVRVADYLRDIASMTNKEDGVSFGGFSGDDAVTPTNVLDQVGFPRERHYQPVGLLSGGERRRLHLAATLLGGPNLLILDEPTNDLDLQTVEMLEHLLDSFTGVVIVVSHDYEFMENNCDKFFVLEGDGSMKLFDGAYSDLMELRSFERTEQAKTAGKSAGGRGEGTKDPAEFAAAAPSASAAVKKDEKSASEDTSEPKKLLKLGFREKMEYEGLEAAIEEMEEEVEGCKAKVSECSASGDYSRLEELTNKLAELENTLEAKSMRWLELAERADIS